MRSIDSQAVILGGSGFIGAALGTYLRITSEVPVKGYTSSDFDLTDPGCVDKLCRVINRNTILIVTARSRQVDDPFSAFANDVAIATNVARCLSKVGAKKCVYFSTTFVYGDTTTDLVITEETKIATSSLYGIAKFTAECVLTHVAEKAGIPTVILRPCMVYGPGDSSIAYGPSRFIKSILLGRRISVFGDGSEVRDYLFIDDLVKITGHFIFGTQSGVYNLGTGISRSFLEIVGHLRCITDEDFQMVHTPRDRPKADLKLDITKLRTAMPGLQFTDFVQGLHATYKAFATKPEEVGTRHD